MRHLFKSILLIAATVAAISSCQKEVVEEASSGEYTYTFALSNAETKAALETDETGTYTKWETGDQLGVYFSGSASVANQSASINITSSPVVFQIKSTSALATGDNVFCYFPYYSGNSSNTAPSSVSLIIPTTQTGRMNSMPMVGTPYQVSANVAANTVDPVSEINMRNLAGLYQFKIFSSESSNVGETVRSVTFTSDDAIAGSFTFDISQESDFSISGFNKTEVTVNQSATVGSSKATAGYVNMVVAPGSHSGTLQVATEKAIYGFNVTTPKTVERSHIKPLNVDLSKADNVVKAPTMTSFSAITGLVAGDSNIKYSATQGNSSTAPGIFSNAVRVYQGGGLFTVSSNGSAKIKSIVIGSSTATKVIYAADGGAVSDTTAISEGGKLTVGDLSASSVVFTCVGADKNSRLNINYLSVTYVGGEDTPVVKMITATPQTGLNPSLGTYNLSNVYQLTNIDESTETINVTPSDGITDVTISGGDIEFKMAPNYTSSAVNGTIKLALASDESVTATIEIKQSASSLVVSEEEIIIPANTTSASFNITSKHFGWSISSNNDTQLGYTQSANASDSPVAVTVTSNVSATDEIQDLGTLTIIRGGNTDDPQKATVVVKKAKAKSDTDPDVLYSTGFENATEHRTSGSNSYGTNTYNLWTTAYADMIPATANVSMTGSYLAQCRIAKNTTNSPSITSSNLLSGKSKISNVTFDAKSPAAFSMVFEYSIDDGASWVTASYSPEKNTSATTYTVSLEEKSIITSTFRIKISFTVASSSGSNRDAQIDEIVVNGFVVTEGGSD